MSDQQLSFLMAESSAFDVNAVDGGLVRALPSYGGSAASELSRRSVDDWVFGLGFTNWKSVIDLALSTGHFDLYESGENCQGLRKYGYRYAPIPRLPAGGATYIQQRLLFIASRRNPDEGRRQKMVAESSDFSHKCAIENGLCDLTIKQGSTVVRVAIPIDHLNFADSSADATHSLAEQLTRTLVAAGAVEGEPLCRGSRALASHLVRITREVR